ncbi:hypothetical protein BKA58DRAFT_471295 [Alternaria rosae]|uniref:uncharacterized protein n=1 Tax=Alternaria rosae TaxID=1187941 RepID=UPI001E8E20C3|nr:uncharacterized protein BKA58DRAFT_471295 [Alternaria rosae]KAH6867091.1 hypothetical protein BKA58DRAFT_471295 [Alternaria rosae]
MPSNGLYRMPQHHLTGQGASMKRPSYNSMDFKEDEEPAPIRTNDGATDETAEEEKHEQKQEKAERKEAKRLKRLSKEVKVTKEPEKVEGKQNTPPVDATPTVKLAGTPLKNGRYGPRGPYKKREIGPDGTPVSTTKKRKRESEAAVPMPATVPTESPKKRPGRPKVSDKKDVVESNKIAKKIVKPGETKAKKQKLEKAPAASDLHKSSKVVKTPVPAPSVAAALSSRPRQTPVPLPQKTTVPPPQKTPVPLPQKIRVPFPQKSPQTLKDGVSKSSAKKTKAVSAQSEVLVTETPLSQMSRTPTTTPRVSAIPFSLAAVQSSEVTTAKKNEKALTFDESSPDIPLMTIAKLAKADKHVIGSQGSVNPLTNSQIESFTSANPMNSKEPLNDAPKPRHRGRRAVSEATSTTSSTSSSTTQSVLEMYLRPNKPYTRPSEELSPFNNNKKKKKHMEKHIEASFAVFATAFTTSQRTINFTDEAEYMEEYDEWLYDSKEAGPLPCLPQVTGCSPKSEQLLQLQHSDDTDTAALRVVVTNALEVEKATADIKRAETASTFLRYSILTRVPMPLGAIEGSWKLYCPMYTETHVDNHGFGQRTLRISSIIGLSAASGAHSASLSILPRSMPYATHAFHAPPHASFRTVQAKTVADDHKIYIMFLGNGYLKLRVDLHLLTTGKTATEKKAAKMGKQAKIKAGQGIWEFLGVHEKAVDWEPEVDELEKEGRRLTAKYDGR